MKVSGFILLIISCCIAHGCKRTIFNIFVLLLNQLLINFVFLQFQKELLLCQEFFLVHIVHSFKLLQFICWYQASCLKIWISCHFFYKVSICWIKITCWTCIFKTLFWYLAIGCLIELLFRTLAHVLVLIIGLILSLILIIISIKTMTNLFSAKLIWKILIVLHLLEIIMLIFIHFHIIVLIVYCLIIQLLHHFVKINLNF